MKSPLSEEEGQMKRFVCMLLILALLPCAAALADLEDWEYYVDPDFSIRYPDYLEVYGVPEEENTDNTDPGIDE